jgi:lipase chaperone LimK
MPKSRNRKDHKKKVAARNNRLKAQRNTFNKKLQEMFAKREQVLTTENVTDVESDNTNEENN